MNIFLRMVLITPGNTICAVWEPFNFRFEVSSMYITLVTKTLPGRHTSHATHGLSTGIFASYRRSYRYAVTFVTSASLNPFQGPAESEVGPLGLGWLHGRTRVTPLIGLTRFLSFRNTDDLAV
ncbi:hypothetical protein EV126DRAFT_25818, partial [Verticillium dahliae]